MVVAGPAESIADSELLERYARGDAASFAALVARHGPMVLRVCRRSLADANDVEDAFQVTFLALLHKAGSIRNRPSIASWLYKVAYRAALAVRQQRRRTQTPADTETPVTTPALLDEITGRELLAVLDEELTSLGEKYRAPLVLCYMEGATTDEAARQLGWSQSTLKRRLRRGRACLSQRLARRGLALSVLLVPAVLSAAPVPVQTLQAMTALVQSPPAVIPDRLRPLVDQALPARCPVLPGVLAVLAAIGLTILLVGSRDSSQPAMVAPAPDPVPAIAPVPKAVPTPVLTDERYRDDTVPLLISACRPMLI